MTGRFLRFDPLGLTIGERGHEYIVPWDSISGLGEFELHSVVIMPVHFGVPAESLCAAIANYVANREARAELRPKTALPPPD